VSAPPTPAQRAWLVLSAAVILGPSLVAVAWPAEAWPWTCAPMFAEPHHEDTALYRPRIIVEHARGESDFDARDIGIAGWHFRRLLLMKAYGSAVPGSPFRFLADDTPEAFEARLDAFFDATMEGVDRRQKNRRFPDEADGLRLQLERVTGAPASRIVGRYDLHTRTFRRVP
jgi:hypothetical protein